MNAAPLGPVRLLVIGGSSGIGEATARLAAEGGSLVTIASRSVDKLAAAQARLRAQVPGDVKGAVEGALQGDLPGDVQTAVLDVTDDAAVQAFFERHPPWDHVVLAGSATQTGPVRGQIRGLPLEAARRSADNKFWGAYHVARHARVADGGSITFVSGVYAQRPQPDAVLQGALNAAVEALARGLALELAPAVRVNTVSPSTTATPLWDKLGADGRAAKLATMRARLPLRRVAEPADIAQAILFVAANRFATGSTLLVDGGDALV
jgi:NAD(P)-dependent dehydrogenase (short-subunit alcohol dehydrogenase family)